MQFSFFFFFSNYKMNFSIQLQIQVIVGSSTRDYTCTKVVLQNLKSSLPAGNLDNNTHSVHSFEHFNYHAFRALTTWILLTRPFPTSPMVFSVFKRSVLSSAESSCFRFWRTDHNYNLVTKPSLLLQYN